MKISNFQIENYIQKIATEEIAGCVIYGPEQSLVNYRFDLVSKKIVSDLSDPFLVSNLNKEKLSDKGILADEFFSFSMLGGRKLILVKDSDVACAAALKVLFEDDNFHKSDWKNSNFILIAAGDLDRSSALRKMAEDNSYFAAIPCYEDDERVIKKFIFDELRKKQIKSSPQVVDYMLESLGKNRQTILAELEKIEVFLADNKDLTPEIAEKLIGSEAEISANEFVMSFASKNFNAALLHAEKLFRNGFEPITLIRFVSNYLQKLYHAKIEIENGLDFESAVKAQRLFFKVEAEFRKNLKNLDLKFLINVLDNLEKLEAKIKSGATNSKILFTSFVQRMAVS